MKKLLPAEAAEKIGYKRKRRHIIPSMPHIGLYIGLKGTPEALGLPRTNFWIYPSADHDSNVQQFLDDPENTEFPVVYISFPAAKDPDYQNRWPGTSTIEIVAPTTWEMFEPWQDTTWGKRGEDYEVLKQKITDQLLEVMYEKLPQLRGKVDYVETSTPLSTAWFCRYGRGELYGLDHNPERFEQDWLKPKNRHSRALSHRPGHPYLRRGGRDDWWAGQHPGHPGLARRRVGKTYFCGVTGVAQADLCRLRHAPEYLCL